MTDFKICPLQVLQEYVGKEIYIIHPGIGRDQYWGTIDSEPPHLLKRTIKSFSISKNSISIETTCINESYDAEEWKIFFDEKEAQVELEKLM